MTASKKQNTRVADFATDINESFLANINHAMRTPLNGLVGMIELMSKTGLDENQLKYAHIMRESAELLMLQLDNIVELAETDTDESTVHIEPCILEDVVKDALQPMIPLAVKKKIPVNVIYRSDLPEAFYTDGKRLRKILTNLLNCSLKLAERGKIILKISKELVNEASVLRFSVENSKLLYYAMQNESKHYHKLSSIDLSDFGEISVSLITAKRLLTSLGSEVRIDDVSGKISSLHFDLPLRPEVAITKDSAYSVLKGKRALVIQSDTSRMNLLLQSLWLWGIDYHCTNNEDNLLEDLKKAYKEGSPYDLLFFADSMPTADITELDFQLPKTVLISHDLPNLSEEEQDKFSACLCPPVYPKELLSTLLSFYPDAVYDREATLSSAASQLVTNHKFEGINANVMIVEDDPVSRMYAEEILESFGCKVSIAENGLHALAKLSNFSEYDLIFMDCMMPRMDGYVTTQRIRSEGYNNVPIIALTANSLELDEDRCLAAGMNDYITKPVKEQELYSVLIRHLRGAIG